MPRILSQVLVMIEDHKLHCSAQASEYQYSIDQLMDGGFVYYCTTMYIRDTYRLQHRQCNFSTYLIFYELLLLGSLLCFLFRL